MHESAPMAAMPIRVYRLIKGPRPTREDFLSDNARGRTLRSDSPEIIARHEGFSAWRNEASVRAVGSRYPRLGTQIVELELPPGTELWPFHDNPDHVTVFGDADMLLQHVVRIAPLA